MAQPPPYHGNYQHPPPPIVTAPQPAYFGNPPVNNNNMMSANTTVVMPGYGIAQPAPTTIYQTRRSGNDCCSGESPNFNGAAGRVTGLIMLVCGIVTIIVIAIALGVRNFYSYSGIGSSIAASIFFYIPAGLLGAFSYQKSRCVIIGYLVMCILTAIESFAMIVYEATAASLHSYDLECVYNQYWYGTMRDCEWEQNETVVACHAFAAFIALVVFVTSITGSVFCCTGMGNSRTTPATVITYTSAPGPSVIQTSASMAGPSNGMPGGYMMK